MSHSKEAELETAAVNLARKGEELVTGAAAKARATVEEVSERIGEASSAVKDNLRKAGKEAADAVSTVSNRVRSSADYLQEQGIPGIMDDVETLIKRYPLQAVLIGAGIGFLLARRNSR